MAVTTDLYAAKDGSPTSWSGAVDNITYGYDENKRLFFISAGNFSQPTPIDYPGANIIESVQNPGQAWNAITVGAYSNDTRIEEESLKDYSAASV
ncbi:hypothetical protein FACS1894204_13050 [Synergistales bacterium]|nr:hypothetical protein FACS1894204_13050 [Synergistales bacterium]